MVRRLCRPRHNPGPGIYCEGRAAGSDRPLDRERLEGRRRLGGLDEAAAALEVEIASEPAVSGRDRHLSRLCLGSKAYWRTKRIRLSGRKPDKSMEW